MALWTDKIPKTNLGDGLGVDLKPPGVRRPSRVPGGFESLSAESLNTSGAEPPRKWDLPSAIVPAKPTVAHGSLRRPFDPRHTRPRVPTSFDARGNPADRKFCCALRAGPRTKGELATMRLSQAAATSGSGGGGGGGNIAAKPLPVTRTWLPQGVQMRGGRPGRNQRGLPAQQPGDAAAAEEPASRSLAFPGGFLAAATRRAGGVALGQQQQEEEDEDDDEEEDEAFGGARRSAQAQPVSPREAVEYNENVSPGASGPAWARFAMGVGTRWGKQDDEPTVAPGGGGKYCTLVLERTECAPPMHLRRRRGDEEDANCVAYAAKRVAARTLDALLESTPAGAPGASMVVTEEAAQAALEAGVGSLGGIGGTFPSGRYARGGSGSGLGLAGVAGGGKPQPKRRGTVVPTAAGGRADAARAVAASGRFGFVGESAAAAATASVDGGDFTNPVAPAAPAGEPAGEPDAVGSTPFGGSATFMDRLQDFLDESSLEVAHGSKGVEIVPAAAAHEGGLLGGALDGSKGGSVTGSVSGGGMRRWRGQRNATRLGLGAARALQEINDDTEDLAFWMSQSAQKGMRSVAAQQSMLAAQEGLQEQLRSQSSLSSVSGLSRLSEGSSVLSMPQQQQEREW